MQKEKWQSKIQKIVIFALLPLSFDIVWEMEFFSFALSLSKGGSWFEADRSAVLRPKLTTNGRS
jgi:hypothetical protein